MNLNDLLKKHAVAPNDVLVLRHRPTEKRLRQRLASLAAERPDLYNAYQQSHNARVEKALTKAKYVASFVGTEAGKSLFCGLFSVKGWKSTSYDRYWRIPANVELRDSYGMAGFSGDRPKTLWFDLVASDDFYPAWRGRLVVNWPGPERAWWRWADRNDFEVDTIHDVSLLEAIMPPWEELVVDWLDLKSLPSKWKVSLREWRGIYYIFDCTDNKGYVGSAYGKENILGRWLNYGVSGHGGNKELRKRDPQHFRFSILQRVSPDMTSEDVIHLERAWKTRLQTREFGLNEN